MRFLLVLTLLMPFAAIAGLERLNITNLNFDYVSPKGSGVADKIEVGVSKLNNQTVEVEKLETSILARTGIVDFEWMNAWKPLFAIEKLQLTNSGLKTGRLSHELTIPKGTVSVNGDYKILNGTAHCQGTSEHTDIEDRILEDCRESMKVEADRLDVPFDFFLLDVLAKLPQPDEEQPFKNFTFTVKEGEFYLYFLMSYVVKAGLRAWGNLSYEDENKIIVLRVDLIKFGYIPVTTLVMKELKERIKSPDVKVEPPFIRIKVQ